MPRWDHAAEVFAWRLVAPALLLVFALLIIPLAFSLYVSFHRWDITVVPNVLRWAGTRNYASILSNPETWTALSFTLTYTVLSVAGEFVLGLTLALLLDRLRVGHGVFISLLIMPMMIAPLVTGLAWRLMLNSEYGPLNQALSMQGTLWLGDVNLARISVVAATIWQEAPFMMVLLLAGLRALPREPLEAAMIDGANWWQTLFYVTLPLLKPVIMVALLIRTIFEMRAFDIIWILTNGGPAGGTDTLSLLNFRTSFRHFQIGPGAALSWLMMLITTIIALWYIRVLAQSRNQKGAA